ncbi:MAG: ester cyclase [Acidimicrobiia bacterium]|nr:ester cyclase [Acidimicrobiia bacterium]
MNQTATRHRVSSYFDAWNSRAPLDVVAAFGTGATYCDPSCENGPIPAHDLADRVEGLATAFPDFSFDTDMPILSDDQTAHVRWMLRGTNTGPYNGMPPSTRAIELPGVDIVEVGDDGVRHVVRHFDRQTMATQLGLQVLIQPSEIGPFRFGHSVGALPKRSARPSAVAVTWIEARSPEEAAEVQRLSRPVMEGLCEVDGFIGGFGLGLGSRLYTITAWEDPADLRHLGNLPAHQDAARRFLTDDFCAAAFTGVWPVGTSQWSRRRCPSCSELTDPRRHPDKCPSCGAALQELSPW